MPDINTGYTWKGQARLLKRLARMKDPDPTKLLEEWERIIVDDNRRGVLAGQDKHGGNLPPVTYRPMTKPLRWTKKKQAAVPAHGNLTSAQYRRLTGPPLAPRRANSRVITHLQTGHGKDSRGWFAVGAWIDVVSVKGVPFLAAHFKGGGRLPKRDIDGVRPWGMRRAQEALRKWGKELVAP